jgi:rare lipoprotein A
MASTRRGRASDLANEAGASWSQERAGNAAGRAVLARWLVVALSAATLAACARSPEMTAGPDTATMGNPAAVPSAAPAQPTPQASSAPQLTPPPAASVPPRRPHYVPRGVASYYTAPQPTANGEVFDTTAMTAAHRSLPFGTRLRVTRLDNGLSVTVRINDRGPYIDGRVVDLSYAAAAKLGMVETGLADVRLSVVHWPKPRPHKPPAQQAAPANARPLPRPAPTRLTLLRLPNGTARISR